MFHGISHVDLQTTNLQQSNKLWSGVIGFSVKSQGDGFIEIDSGNVALRLIEVPIIEQTSTIRISVADVTSGYQQLINAGATSRYEPMKTPDLEKIACIDRTTQS